MLRKAIIYEKKENPERCFLQKYLKMMQTLSKPIKDTGYP